MPSSLKNFSPNRGTQLLSLVKIRVISRLNCIQVPIVNLRVMSRSKRSRAPSALETTAWYRGYPGAQFPSKDTAFYRGLHVKCGFNVSGFNCFWCKEVTTQNCIHVPPATLRRVKKLYNLYCLSNWRRGSETSDVIFKSLRITHQPSLITWLI